MRQTVNNNRRLNYLNLPKWASSILANASNCHLEDVGSILTLSKGDN